MLRSILLALCVALVAVSALSTSELTEAEYEGMWHDPECAVEQRQPGPGRRRGQRRRACRGSVPARLLARALSEA